MEVINSGMRKSIKILAVTCQTAQFISLMPKPKDFVTRIVGDVVYLSAKIQKLSDDINILLDSYADIPAKYFMTEIESISNSMIGVIDRVNIYSQNAVNQTFGVGENTLGTISELLGTTIDTAKYTTDAVVSLGSAVAHGTSAIIGDTEIATHINDAAEVVMEWTGEHFDTIRDSSVKPLNDAIDAIENKRNGITNSINNTLTNATKTIDDKKMWVENLLKDLKNKMDGLAKTFDSAFSDSIGITSVSTGAMGVAEALRDAENDSPASQAVTAMSVSISNVLKNFSISKVAAAFTGILTQTVIVKLGLDKLPPIDFESMLNVIRSEQDITSEELMRELNSTIDDIDEFNESIRKSDERNYNSKNYEKFVKQFDEEIKQQRDEILVSMRTRNGLSEKQLLQKETLEKRELRSAIKEVRKYKRKVKNAKKASKFSSILGDELINFRKEVEYRCNEVRSDWNDMMNQYKKAISEIKEFFQNGGDGDRFIDDCCMAINRDCDAIKELCKNLGTQLIATTIKTVSPSDIGVLLVPNPVYKLADFWMDIKTILKFIKDLINLVIDIMNNINKLARIMLNGINNLNEIIKQLMDIIGLEWFMNLVQDIIDFFGEKIGDARFFLENMVSPIYYKDTEEYNEILDLFESYANDDSIKPKKMSWTYFGEVKKFDEKTLDKLEEMGDDIVAYKSPIIIYNEIETDSSKKTKVSDLMSGGSMFSDVNFIGWIIFHPNLNYEGYHGNKGSLYKKIKSRIIKRASKTSNKKNGGLAGLKSTKKWKIKDYNTSYNAFYWYTYYTEDLEKDVFEFKEFTEGTKDTDKIFFDSAVRASNGTIVELSDGRKAFVADTNVRSGDYITIGSEKYKVR